MQYNYTPILRKWLAVVEPLEDFSDIFTIEVSLERTKMMIDYNNATLSLIGDNNPEWTRDLQDDIQFLTALQPRLEEWLRLRNIPPFTRRSLHHASP
ncbi:hypothetical protein [Aquibium oceanicum]|uniref:Uncharacterized protein n=1 Tax=Aquibium oceanicum TaxID=1670800 RepID=A0A1L3SXL7_9HYPH|nr:hypothetical protein [Aquibium oceanicum]APH74138.1 hypothetical protein BSQ44_24275 [Aquibium oceanicum]